MLQHQALHRERKRMPQRQVFRRKRKPILPRAFRRERRPIRHQELKQAHKLIRQQVYRPILKPIRHQAQRTQTAVVPTPKPAHQAARPRQTARPRQQVHTILATTQVAARIRKGHSHTAKSHQINTIKRLQVRNPIKTRTATIRATATVQPAETALDRARATAAAQATPAEVALDRARATTAARATATPAEVVQVLPAAQAPALAAQTPRQAVRKIRELPTKTTKIIQTRLRPKRQIKYRTRQSFCTRLHPKIAGTSTLRRQQNCSRTTSICVPKRYRRCGIRFVTVKAINRRRIGQMVRIRPASRGNKIRFILLLSRCLNI